MNGIKKSVFGLKADDFNYDLQKTASGELIESPTKILFSRCSAMIVYETYTDEAGKKAFRPTDQLKGIRLTGRDYDVAKRMESMGLDIDLVAENDIDVLLDTTTSAIQLMLNSLESIEGEKVAEIKGFNVIPVGIVINGSGKPYARLGLKYVANGVSPYVKPIVKKEG